MSAPSSETPSLRETGRESLAFSGAGAAIFDGIPALEAVLFDGGGGTSDNKVREVGVFLAGVPLFRLYESMVEKRRRSCGGAAVVRCSVWGGPPLGREEVCSLYTTPHSRRRWRKLRSVRIPANSLFDKKYCSRLHMRADSDEDREEGGLQICRCARATKRNKP